MALYNRLIHSSVTTVQHPASNTNYCNFFVSVTSHLPISFYLSQLLSLEIPIITSGSALSPVWTKDYRSHCCTIMLSCLGLDRLIISFDD